MTDEEIEGYRRRLNTLTAELSDKKPEGTIRPQLQDLAREVGASTWYYGVRFIDSTHKSTPADTSVLISNIHQALQTASMVNMCKTATEGYEMATRASRNARIHFSIAAVISFICAVAAWVAAIRN